MLLLVKQMSHHTSISEENERFAKLALIAAGGAILAPVIIGGGIGVTIMGGAFGIGPEIVALAGAVGAAKAGDKFMKK